MAWLLTDARCFYKPPTSFGTVLFKTAQKQHNHIKTTKTKCGPTLKEFIPGSTLFFFLPLLVWNQSADCYAKKGQISGYKQPHLMHGANYLRPQLSKQDNRTNLTKPQSSHVPADSPPSRRRFLTRPAACSTPDLQPTGRTL